LDLPDIQRCLGHTFSLDVETTGLEWWNKELIGVGVHCPELEITGYYPTLSYGPRQWVKEVLRELGSDSLVVAHNLKFEWHFLGINPYEVQAKWVDTTVLAHIHDSRLKKALPNLERIFLGGDSKQGFSDKAPHGKKKKIWEWPLDLVAPYCINDCVVEYDLYIKLAHEVDQLGLWTLFLKDMRYLQVLWKAENHGHMIDPVFLEEAQQDMTRDILQLERILYDAVGYEFNWRSPKQLSQALYDDMGFERPKNPYADADGVDRSKFADKGLYHGPMTASFLLTEKVKHPMGPTVASLREAWKLRGNIRKWIEGADDQPATHGGFNITGTRTSRLSSSKPNMQNIASKVRTKETQSVYSGQDSFERTESYNLRRGFIARPGYSLIATDYAQMEMRMFGLISQDPNMLPLLTSGQDIHGNVAERVWGTRDPVHREWAKTVGFGLLYGMTTGSLMHRLDMTYKNAKRVSEDYWGSFPNWSGRMWREESQAHFYKGANAKIQGGCADVLSIAAIRVDNLLTDKYGGRAWILNFVHDELIVEAPDELVEELVPQIRDIMQVEDLFDMVWAVSSKVGKSYGTLEDVSGAEY
jgi:DNA polymerase-1